MIMANKIITIIFWLAALTCWVIGAEGIWAWLPKIADVILIIHVFEVAVFLTMFRKYSQQPALDAVQVLIFGMFHLQGFIKQHRAAS